MADRRPRSRHVDLEYTFDRLLARKLEQAYDILVPDRVRRTGEQTGPSERLMKIAAIYARVSSDQQKEEKTIASQTAALVEFSEGYSVPDEWVFQDPGGRSNSPMYGHLKIPQVTIAG